MFDFASYVGKKISHNAQTSILDLDFDSDEWNYVLVKFARWKSFAYKCCTEIDRQFHAVSHAFPN